MERSYIKALGGLAKELYEGPSKLLEIVPGAFNGFRGALFLSSFIKGHKPHSSLLYEIGEVSGLLGTLYFYVIPPLNDMMQKNPTLSEMPQYLALPGTLALTNAGSYLFERYRSTRNKIASENRNGRSRA